MILKRSSHRPMNRAVPRRSPAQVDQLVKNAQAGDHVALGDLLENQVRPQALAISARMLRNWHDAEDVTSLVTMRVLEKLGRYRAGLGSFRNWVSAIARNAAVSYLRRRKRMASLPEAGHPVTGCPDPAADAELRDSVAELERKLREISAPQRAAIRLRYFKRLSLREIAVLEGVSPGTVGSRLHYGLQALRERLSPADK